MKRGYVARRYRAGGGEPLAYDRDGQLRERPITQTSGREMVAAMQSLVPDLAAKQIPIVVSGRKKSSKWGEWYPEAHTIYLYAGGSQ